MLGVIHGNVCMVEQLGKIFTVSGVECNPDTDTDIHLSSFPDKGFQQTLGQLLAITLIFFMELISTNSSVNSSPPVLATTSS